MPNHLDSELKIFISVHPLLTKGNIERVSVKAENRAERREIGESSFCLERWVKKFQHLRFQVWVL